MNPNRDTMNRIAGPEVARRAVHSLLRTRLSHLLCAAALLVGCTDSGEGEPFGTTAGPSGSVTSDFPTIFALSDQSFDPFTGLQLVEEGFVVAFEDGSYTRDQRALFGEAADPPGRGERRSSSTSSSTGPCTLACRIDFPGSARG